MIPLNDAASQRLTPLRALTATRGKVAQACLNCRRLRIKCGVSRPCQPCLARSFHCIDSAPSADQLSLNSAYRRIAALEAKLAAHDLGEPETQLSASSTVEHDGPRIDLSTTERVNEIVSGVNRMSAESGRPEYFGSSSSDAILYVLRDSSASGTSDEEVPLTGLDRVHVWRSDKRSLCFPIGIAGTLPPRHIVNAYVKSYLHTVHRIYPIIVAQEFIGRVDRFWNGLPTEGHGYTLWAAVFYMVMALGHQMLSLDDDPRPAGVELDHGEMFFKTAKHLLANAAFESGDMSTVNSLLLAAIWLSNDQRRHEAYVTLGLAMRIAFAIGLHTEPRRIMDDENREESDCWQITFWSLAAMECDLAMTLGRPCSISTTEGNLTLSVRQPLSDNHDFVEKMRQLMELARRAQLDMYYPARAFAGMKCRITKLENANRSIDAWLDTWQHTCTWVREPYHVIISIKELHVRLVLHRVFLAVLYQSIRYGRPIDRLLLDVSIRCIAIASKFVQLAVSAVSMKSSGILHAFVFQSLALAWDAAVTAMLCVSDQALLDLLYSSTQSNCPKPYDILETAERFFSKFKHVSPFADKACREIHYVLRKSMLRQGSQNNESSDMGMEGARSSSGPDASSIHNIADVSSFSWDWNPSQIQGAVSHDHANMDQDFMYDLLNFPDQI